jgi:HK97 family phage portal protein
MSKFGDFIKSTVLKAATTLNPGVFGFFSNNSFPSMTEREQLKAYRGWVYACVNVIAQMVAQMDLKLMQKEGEDWKETEDQPILETLKRVNDWQSFFDLIFATESFLQLDGNAYWYLVRNNKKEIVEIWNLDPTKMSIYKSKKDFVSGYSFMNETGVKIPLEVNEILHIHHFHPLNPYKGFGTVAAAALAIDTDTFAAEYQRNFFGNSAMPSAVLSTDQKLSQDQYDRIKGNWDARYKGVQNSSKLALLEAGLKFQPLNPTAKEMQFTEGRKNLRDEILAIFRVPKVILGITEDVNYAAATATEYVFTKFVIKPEIQFLVSKLNEFLIPLFGLDTAQFKFGFTDPVPENLDQKRADRDSGIEHSYLTINEARAEMDYDPIDGGDILIASTMVAPLLGDGASANDQNTAKGIRIKKRLMLKKNYKKKLLIQKAKFAKRNAYVSGQVGKQSKIFRGLNDDLEKMLLSKLKTKGAGKTITKETANDIVHIIFENYQDWVGLLFDATKQGLQKVMEQSGKDAVAEVGVSVDFDLQNPRALNWLNDHALEDTNSYSSTIKDDIALRIQEGVEMGASTDDIAGMIEEFFGTQSDYRAERLARTEVINAYNGGNLEGYRQSGVVVGKEWLPDESACDICLGNADDGVIGLDEDFSSGDDAPTAHPNCECSLQPVTGDTSGEE